MGIIHAIWEKWVEFRHEWKTITISLLINPLLYILAFGFGLGRQLSVDGQPYIQFLLPGVIALTTMNTGFSSTATYLNIQKMFERSLDQVMVSPTPIWQYILGTMIGGGLRSVYAGILILLLGLLFQVRLHVSLLLVFLMLLNGMVYAGFGVLAALIAKNHGEVQRFSSYFILPMTFLCNTFFSLDTLPIWLRSLIRCLPLTHASEAIRSAALQRTAPPGLNLSVLSAYALLFFALSCFSINRIREI